MAFNATVWEIRTGGDDSNNGGGFDTSVAVSFPTDGAATLATSSAPKFTSSSYTFVAGDVGHWIFIRSGTNWIPGWYKITAVTASPNSATLDATIGHAALFSTSADGGHAGVSRATGCATTGSPSSATWGLDYSQADNAPFSSSTFSTDGTNTHLLDSTNTIGKNWIGNIVVITGAGSGFTLQRVRINSTSGTTATCDKSLGGTNLNSGVGKMGGALKSPGKVISITAVGTVLAMWIQSGSYTISSASTNVAGGCVSAAGGIRIEGYATYRGDMGTAPTFTASSISTATIFATSLSAGGALRNLTVDGASLTSIRGFDSGYYILSNLTAKNCTNIGVRHTGTGTLYSCRATGCATISPAISEEGGNNLLGCIADANTVSGIGTSTSSGALIAFCISANNTGGSSDGFNTIGARIVNCTAYGNGRHGFNGGTDRSNSFYLNCVAEGHSNGWGFTQTFSIGGQQNNIIKYCATYNNNSGAIDTTPHWIINENNITYTSTAFNNAGSGDFSLNQSTTGGRLLRGTGFPGAFANSLGTTGFIDIGAVQAPFAKEGYTGIGIFVH